MSRCILSTLTTTIMIGLSGCGGTAPQIKENTQISDIDFLYEGHNFGPNRSETYKKGVIDGCKTSNGDYTKDHTRFKNDIHYHDGWEHGRLHCKGTPAQQ